MIYVRVSLLGAIVVYAISVSATVIIHNETDRVIYAGVYYYLPVGIAELQTLIVTINQNSQVELEEPLVKVLENRHIIFDDQPLHTPLNYEQFKLLGTVPVRLPGHYYIALKDGRLKGYTLTEWHVINPLVRVRKEITQVMTQPLSQKIKAEQPAVQQNFYKTSPVMVRASGQLHPDELIFRTRRQPVVRRGLEKLLTRSLQGKYVPEICVVMSGGGYRAMLYSAGSLASAQNATLFDTVMYISSLSGSTWALASIMHEYMRGNHAIEKMVYNLMHKATKNIADLTSHEAGLLSDVLLWKAAFAQPLSSLDIFGLLLGNLLFSDYGDMRHRTYLSQQAKVLVNGAVPFPIYTAVPAETTELEKLMYEFTPYEVRSPWGLSIPPYAFGNRFINGIRTKNGEIFAPEQPMSILLGTFGSAYAFTLKRAYQEIEDKTSLIVRAIVETIPKEVGQTRIASADFNNFTMGMSQSIIKNNKIMQMADAGLGVTGGLPFQPVSGVGGRRKADIYIIIDMSEDIENGKDLQKIAQYMTLHGLKFPRIASYQGLERTMISVFNDPTDKDVPTVIYMPRTKEQAVWEKYKMNPAYLQYNSLETFSMEACITKEKADCTSTNLQYDLELARNLVQLGAFNMQASMEAIKKAINECIDRKSR